MSRAQLSRHCWDGGDCHTNTKTTVSLAESWNGMCDARCALHAARVALTLSGTLPGPLLAPVTRLLFRDGLDSRLKGLFLGGIVDALKVRLLLRYVPSLRRGVDILVAGEVRSSQRRELGPCVATGGREIRLATTFYLISAKHFRLRLIVRRKRGCYWCVWDRAEACLLYSPSGRTVLHGRISSGAPHTSEGGTPFATR